MQENCGRFPYYNQDGYPDPTAYEAMAPIQKIQDDSDKRLAQLIKALKVIIELADYDLLARIEVRDRKTGRTYR